MDAKATSEARERDAYNGVRWLAGDPKGHYESWFCRANHPSRPLAFWIRYTLFSPKGRPKDAIGELWAVWFDGEARAITAVKEEHPIRACTFAKSELLARIADATLDGASLRGRAACGGHAIEWSLRYTSPSPPLFLLDRGLYAGPFPKAKALVGSPFAAYTGTLRVDGREHAIDGWIGSQNHNWGEKHTDRYAWGQVAGFDDAPDAFLEVATAQVKVGPVLTPPLTVLVLRLDGEELAFNTIARAARAKGAYDWFQWRFRTGDERTRIEGTIAAAKSDFVGLPYYDPPGGTKTCLNSKLARCDLTIRRAGSVRTLSTRSRAAFEILTSDGSHGVPVLDVRARG
ncbi:MAG TPA: hypothetical protein VIL20_16830 [Sandaracinaceae bacterium]